MNRKKLISKIMTAVIAGGVLFSAGSYASAKGTNNTKVGSNTSIQQTNMKNPMDTLKTELDKLVTSGTITSDQETAVLNYFKQQESDKKTEMDKIKNMTETERQAYFDSKKTNEKSDFLSELVAAGTLTQTQADAIKAVMPQGHKGIQGAMNSNQAKTSLDNLVTAGTITSDQETSILSALKQEDTDRKAEMDKVKNMTEAERKTYFENKKSDEKTNFLTALVTAGTITQTQADAVESVLHKDSPRGEAGDNMLKTTLDKLVTAGTISETEETNILKYMSDKQTNRKAEMDKVKNMTEAERKAYFESNKSTQKTDLFSELVTAGIITQEKADAIKAAMPVPSKQGSQQGSMNHGPMSHGEIGPNEMNQDTTNNQ